VLVIFLIAVIAALVCVIFFLLNREGGVGRRSSPIPEPPRSKPKPEPEPARRIPDELPGERVANEIAVRLAGAPADGSAPPAEGPSDRVVWVDGGDEVLVHLGSATTRIVDGVLLFSIDLETDQTGRQPMTVAFALGDGSDGTAALAVTTELPQGHAGLAARWGDALQDAAFAALGALADDHAAERDAAPNAIALQDGALQLLAGAPLRLPAPEEAS
jgi:hypothetical protein